MSKRDPVLSAFGRNVKKLREQKGLSQEQLAEKADVDRTYLSDVERGARNLGIKNVARIAKALGTTVSNLCDGIEK
jgi:transcriptional regulator with XRE-family HTH domain